LWSVLAGGRSYYKVGPAEPGTATTLTGVFILTWGALFLASYAFPDVSYVLRGLTWFCENGRGWPTGRWTAILWGCLLIVMGCIAFMQGLGWIEL
jgi:hypothetical protein